MTGILTYGIDVSHYSIAVDWDEVIAQNVHFAFAKASELFFVQYKDPTFGTYWGDLGNRNIKRGAYHFCHPGMDPDQSVGLFFSVYTPTSGDILPSLDVEDDYADDLSVPQTNKIAQIGRMVQLISNRLNGQKPIIYTKQRVWTALGNPGDFGGCPLWVIDYNHTPQPKLPKSWSSFAFWQTDQNKSMPGIQGDFDPDFFNGKPEDMAAYCIPMPNTARRARISKSTKGRLSRRG
jgi:lysozyme